MNSIEIGEASETSALLKSMYDDWLDRFEASKDLIATAEGQLALKLREQSSPAESAGVYFTEFVRSRGRNLVFGLLAFFGVLGVAGIVRRVAGIIQRQRNIPRSFYTRLATLIFQVITFVGAIMAMLAVFNVMNDWLLLGLTLVLLVALAWFGIKMLPGLVEQMTLLLDLGAVQEGERVLFNDVPWRVERLDYYTDLVNPDLEGGTFTLPVRELTGLHSRPAAEDEAWFPTKKGDWVRFEDGAIARVVSQTPEMVRLELLGGALVTYATAAFVELAPVNLSAGYRVEVEFGVDYQHQAISTDELPRKLHTFLRVLYAHI